MYQNVAVINTLANVYSSHRDFSGVFAKMKTAEWSNIFISPAVLLIATILRKAGFNVKIYNDLQNEIDRSRINEEIVLISSITSSSRRAYEIADMFPDRKVILGGVHASSLPEEASEHADHVVTGECENVIVDLVSGKIRDKIVRGSRIEDLDAIPHLDYSLLKKLPDILPVQTSRGCNHKCNYCTVPLMYGGYRSRSPENVVAELTNYRRDNGEINKVDFRIDADFTFDRKRAIKIMELMRAEEIRPRVIAANSRLQIFRDKELLSHLSGRNITLCVGIESLSQEVLDSYEKNQRETEISEAVRVFHDNDIKVMGYLLYGADQDDKDTLKRYKEFINRSKLDYYHISVLTPYPGTGLHRNLISQNRIFTSDWTYYDGLHVTYRPARMSAYEMQKSFYDFYSEEFSWKSMLNPRLLLNFELLRNKFMIYMLLKMFRDDMMSYLTFIEEHSATSLYGKKPAND
jgi:radical SAM superfamily enzyme YgiQ (UPF0313 family)